MLSIIMTSKSLVVVVAGQVSHLYNLFMVHGFRFVVSAYWAIVSRCIYSETTMILGPPVTIATVLALVNVVGNRFGYSVQVS